ncbi:hypothetical protein LC55x_0886 [Lysobacter capsici]|nr:hypothetical protein LC55x_0886 [Lysobacter capsici]
MRDGEAFSKRCESGMRVGGGILGDGLGGKRWACGEEQIPLAPFFKRGEVFGRQSASLRRRWLGWAACASWHESAS